MVREISFVKAYDQCIVRFDLDGKGQRIGGGDLVQVVAMDSDDEDDLVPTRATRHLEGPASQGGRRMEIHGMESFLPHANVHGGRRRRNHGLHGPIQPAGETHRSYQDV